MSKSLANTFDGDVQRYAPVGTQWCRSYEKLNKKLQQHRPLPKDEEDTSTCHVQKKKKRLSYEMETASEDAPISRAAARDGEELHAGEEAAGKERSPRGREGPPRAREWEEEGTCRRGRKEQEEKRERRNKRKAREERQRRKKDEYKDIDT